MGTGRHCNKLIRPKAEPLGERVPTFLLFRCCTAPNEGMCSSVLRGWDADPVANLTFENANFTAPTSPHVPGTPTILHAL